VAAETKKDYFEGFKKLKGVIEAVEALDGVKGYKKLTFLDTKNFGIKKEAVEAIAKLK